MTDPKSSRRPLTSRDTKWAKDMATRLTHSGISPNQISVLSVVFGSLAGAALVGAGFLEHWQRAVLFLAAAACIQLRLLCNLFDGMVAVEGGFKTKSGEIYNELPDRLADAVIFACAGYAVPAAEWLHALGWLAAVLAVMTAYVRALGVTAGASQYFLGPMAKPHRMAAMTVTCVLMATLVFCGRPVDLIHPTLALICAGCVITMTRRVRRIMKELESK